MEFLLIKFLLVSAMCLASCYSATIPENATEATVVSDKSERLAALKAVDFSCSLKGHMYQCCGGAFSHLLCMEVGIMKKDQKDYFEIMLKLDGDTELKKTTAENASVCFNIPVPVFSVQGCLGIDNVNVLEHAVRACLKAEVVVSGDTEFSQNLGCYDLPLPSGQN